MSTPSRINPERNALSTPRRTAGWVMARNQIASYNNALAYGVPTLQQREEQAAFLRANTNIPFTNPANPADPFGPNRPVLQRGSLIKPAQEYSTVFLVGLKLPFTTEDHIRGHFERFGPIKVVEIDAKEKWAHVHFTSRSHAEEAVKHPYDGVTGRVYLPKLTQPPVHQQYTLAELDAGAAETFRQDYEPLFPITNAVRENELTERVYPRIVTEPGFEAAIRTNNIGGVPQLHHQRSLPNLRQRSETNPFANTTTGLELVRAENNTPQVARTHDTMEAKVAYLWAVVHDVKNHTGKLHGRLNQQQAEARTTTDQVKRILDHASYIENQASNIAKNVELVPGLLQKVHDVGTMVDKLDARVHEIQGNLSRAETPVNEIQRNLSRAETRVNEMNHNLMNLNLEFRGWYDELCSMANDLRIEYDSLKQELTGDQTHQNTQQEDSDVNGDGAQQNGIDLPDH